MSFQMVEFAIKPWDTYLRMVGRFNKGDEIKKLIKVGLLKFSKMHYDGVLLDFDVDIIHDDDYFIGMTDGQSPLTIGLFSLLFVYHMGNKLTLADKSICLYLKDEE